MDDASSVRQQSIQMQVRACIGNLTTCYWVPTQGGGKYLYVNTDTSIYRLPVQRCSRFLSCRCGGVVMPHQHVYMISMQPNLSVMLGVIELF